MGADTGSFRRIPDCAWARPRWRRRPVSRPPQPGTPFEWRGCPTPDDYADETINRCARKISEGEEIQDVATYCIGVARMLLREMSRDRAIAARSLDEAPEPQSPPHEPAEEAEGRTECLRRCLGQLSAENRELILAYYQGDKGDKIRNRKGLTQLFGLRSSTLRMRAPASGDAPTVFRELFTAPGRETPVTESSD